jgi:hypothetical protein
MALTLAVQEGESVYIDGRPLKIVTMTLADEDNPEGGWYVVAETPDGTEWELYEDRSVEVFPGVHVQLGTKNQYGKASLAFDAPSKIKIYTEKNYHALHSGQES